MDALLGDYRTGAAQDTETQAAITAALLAYYTSAQVDALLGDYRTASAHLESCTDQKVVQCTFSPACAKMGALYFCTREKLYNVQKSSVKCTEILADGWKTLSSWTQACWLIGFCGFVVVAVACCFGRVVLSLACGCLVARRCSFCSCCCCVLVGRLLLWLGVVCCRLIVVVAVVAVAAAVVVVVVVGC